MSWSQNYSIERLIDFAYGFYSGDYNSFIQEVFEKILGRKVVKIEEIVLVDDPWYGDRKGKRITFADGTVYIHKLIERYTSGGNYGCDTYRLVKESEEVKVKEINEN